MAKCNITELNLLDRVSAMGEIDSPNDLLHYVPLTGREPQLKNRGPVWIIALKGDLLLPGGSILTDPTCVVTADDFGWFGTGPVTDTATGKVSTPEPPPEPPDRSLPSLAP